VSGPGDAQDSAAAPGPAAAASADAALFRRESGRLLATLTRTFGVQNLALAEEVVQETLAAAFAAWSYGGVPAHYAALLTTAAKNRAIDVFRRERTARKFAPRIRDELESEWTLRPAVEELFLPNALRDDELRMIFTCCNPRLDEEGQVALALNVLCGFRAVEIASAFLVTPAAIEKRLSRGKRTLAKSRRLFDLRAEDVTARLSTVHRALYLLFNEGYHGACADSVVRAELCREAMRLVRLLLAYEPTATPASHALAALMCLHAARLPARVDEAGDLRSLFRQDRSLWDAGLVEEGLRLLDASACGDAITVFHVEAGIAALHAAADSTAETRWAEIVRLYDVLMTMRPSPVVALSRAIALAERDGPAAGLEAIGAIEEPERLGRYPFYPAAVGELELRRGNPEVAGAHFRKAHGLARSDAERRFLAQRIGECTSGGQVKR
jgi:RNA polymerase sigma-70 factor (ECF subfamily)